MSENKQEQQLRFSLKGAEAPRWHLGGLPGRGAEQEGSVVKRGHVRR